MKKGMVWIVLITNTVFGQVNLVPNPSFEQCTNCITGPFGPAFFEASIVDWYNPNTCTPDYCTAMDYPAWLNYQIPDGQAFIGLSTYDPVGSNIRDYATCALLDTLLASHWYEVSFYARVKEGHSRFASNNLGVHFSDTALHAANMYLFNVYNPPLLEAQVKYFNNEIISDSAHWTLVRGLYQAHGGEKYLTLGNFNTDAQTTQGMEYTDGIVWQTYFIIDMVSVIPLDSIVGGIPADAGPDTTIYINDTAFIGQKISNMPSVWQKLDGTAVAMNTAGVYVSPQVNTTYVVSQTINGFYSTDTVTVFVIDDLGIDEPEEYNFTVSPNPNKGVFTIQLQQLIKETTELVIYDNTGREVMNQAVESPITQIKVVTAVKPGIYLVQLRQKGTVGKRQTVVIE
ncbi:T9SS type A sorting domain-containing protein [Fluviicola taffensis]|uniref:Secretion system C-terminal sorting domain-containing protein n=1 Tax=Fluviicola taffensis (strain DSM 16823 / NCIMB 13979 / RW262) TaxID=755732 RepID=F2IFX0_FLUTR|nr:T9SS type A sorting domain-containing protein [Fluviicola taffensis]AEA43591.1 hypothetical protein Fluta_1599 [Fluviicola taffensis DSM 16823]